MRSVQEAWHGKGQLQDYEMADYWDTKFPMNLFGLNSPDIRSRQALESQTSQQEQQQQQQFHSRRLMVARR